MEALLTVNQVAKHVQLHRETILVLIRGGKLRAVKFGKSWRVDPEDLRKYINRRKTKAVA